MNELPTQVRNAELPDLVEMLRKQSDVRYDIVVPGSSLKSEAGQLVVKDGTARFAEDGLHTEDARLVPTSIFDEGVASRFDIPLRYVRTMRNRVNQDVEKHPRFQPGPYRPALLDENVNYWLDANPNRKHLVRGFLTDGAGEPGIARAFLSDRYKPIDNFDVLMATLAGVRQAGTEVEIDGADLSDRRMTVRLVCPEVTQYAEDLLSSYRSPFSGNTGSDNPTIFAGLVIKNSETGGGAFTIVPRLVVQVCSNGLQMTKDAVREVHLGGKLDEGVIRWSDETQRQELELISSRARDAVATFVDVEYMKAKIEELRALADVQVANPSEAIHRVAKRSGWSDNEANDILLHFIGGGDTSALGLAQAVTSTAQLVEAPDRQDELEATAIPAAELVAVA